MNKVDYYCYYAAVLISRIMALPHRRLV